MEGAMVMEAVLQSERLTDTERGQLDGLWRASYRELFKFTVYRLWGDECETGEILSDLAMLWLNPRKFRSMGDNPSRDIFERFSKATLKFAIINRWRNRRTPNYGSLILDEHEGLTPSVLRMPSTDPGPTFSPVEADAMRAERDRILRAKIRALRPNWRRAVIMCFFLGYTLERAGKRLGTSKENVRQLLCRAISTLAERRKVPAKG
jgi:RNA polymerase sigma factor (sigma-70 family)